MTSQAAFSNNYINETDVTSNSIMGDNKVLSVEKLIAIDKLDLPESMNQQKTVE